MDHYFTEQPIKTQPEFVQGSSKDKPKSGLDNANVTQEEKNS
jgi:hypothetical protein